MKRTRLLIDARGNLLDELVGVEHAAEQAELFNMSRGAAFGEGLLEAVRVEEEAIVRTKFEFDFFVGFVGENSK